MKKRLFMGKLHLILRFFPWTLLFLTVALLAAFLLLSIAPDRQVLASNPNPATSYAEAVQRIQTLQANEGAEFNPLCRSKFMDHGSKMARVIVFLHGYTNCPEQFRQLGEMFFAQGYNVLITPQPYMGLADRLNVAQEQLTAEDLAAYTDGVVDIAQGLGEQVILAGLSGGGVMAAWAAEVRSELHLAVVIAPSFGYTFIPDPLTIPLINLFRMLPNSYQWWDSEKKMNTVPDYAYPRISTRALAEILRMAIMVKDEACRQKPAAGSILVITNDADMAVVNAHTNQVVQCWRQQSFLNISEYRFGASLKLGHDLIDPSQADQRIDLVYPLLVELVGNIP